jgi:3-oxoacyl-[acyl-carrier-protein] synthase II
MSNRRRVVITGIGTVTPVGIDEASFWTNMIAGKCGIRNIEAFDLTDYKARNGAEVDDSQLTPALQAHGINTGDRTVDMGMLAAAQALKQAGITIDQEDLQPRDTATIVGTGVGSSHSLYNAFMSFSEKGLRGLRPTSVPRCMGNSVSSRISMRFRLTGPNYAVISACTSSTNATGLGYRMIRDGYANEVLCVGSDAPFDPFVYGGWNNMGVMSRNPDPSKSCRPFDIDRDGCVLGEGAGAFLLESMDMALARQARIRGEIAGYGESSDAEHITRPSAEGQAKAMRSALSSAGLGPSDIGFINAHGTATRANDETESVSVRMVVDDDADRIPVASNKSAFGHLLGAAGIVESIATVLGLEHREMPPNLNLDNPDPKCNLCFVGSKATEIESPLAMKNSFGFGGNNAVLILRRWDED